MTSEGPSPLLAAYLDLARRLPELFETPERGVRILLDPAEIMAVQRDIVADLRARGLPDSGADVGKVFDDPWFSILRDAVEFPDGSRRLHTRVMNHKGDGVAVFPVFDGRIVLTRQFRHPLRKFLLEIPRGAIEPGHTFEDTAHNEVREEIGGAIAELVKLGYVHGSTNLYQNGAHLYFGHLSRVGAPQLYEGIIAVEQYTVPEFEALLTGGELTDSFTVAGYAHAKARGLI